MPSGTPVLILPGYGDSGPDHWQSHWERADPTFRRVVQDDWLLPKLADWIARLEAEVAVCVTPPILAAHSLACSLVAHWAMRPGARAAGALLVAPADVDSPAHTADEVRNFSPVPMVPLPFPSIVVASTDDPFVTPARAAAFAHAWGSRLVTFERAGHLNADAGFGPWPEGRRLLAELTTGRHDDLPHWSEPAHSRDAPMMDMTLNIPEIVAEVRALFERYEQALIDKNVDVLDATFWDSPHTIRYAFHENGYGFAQIHAHRVARPPGPGTKEKRIRLEILTLGRDLATVNLEFKMRGQDAIGRQSQTWVRFPALGWKVVSAHVSAMSPPPSR